LTPGRRLVWEIDSLKAGKHLVEGFVHRQQHSLAGRLQPSSLSPDDKDDQPVRLGDHREQHRAAHVSKAPKVKLMAGRPDPGLFALPVELRARITTRSSRRCRPQRQKGRPPTSAEMIGELPRLRALAGADDDRPTTQGQAGSS